MTRRDTTEILVKLGKKLGFQVGTEIQASDSAWVDVVWFENKFDFGPKKGEKWSRAKTWRQPVLPVVGFEIEASAGAKPLKGSIANLNDLGALMRKRVAFWMIAERNSILFSQLSELFYFETAKKIFFCWQFPNHSATN